MRLNVLTVVVTNTTTLTVLQLNLPEKWFSKSSWMCVVTSMSSCWLGALVSCSSVVRDGRCEKAAEGRDKKELSSSSLIKKSTELAADTGGTNMTRLRSQKTQASL